MITIYENIHLQGDSTQGAVWFQHPPPRGGHGADVRGETQALPYHGGPLGTAPAAPHPKPVRKPSWGHIKC